MKWLALFACAGILLAQENKPTPAEQEQQELSRAVSEAGSSSVDFVRALERHLKKYPASPQRLAIEKAIAKSALDANDRPRILLYGQKVLAAEPETSDLPLLDRVIRVLLDADDQESAKKALALCARYLRQVEAMRNDSGKSHMSEAQWAEEVSKGRARALALQARATGNTGDAEGALRIAKSSWESNQNAESAREVSRWLLKLNRNAEALEYLADAFAIEDGRATDADRARDRQRMGEIYAKLNGSEKGLGDLILAAYDRMSAAHTERLAKLRQADPNIVATELMDFTLLPVEKRDPLPLSSLNGKTVVMDFWATWCGPCRVQHPIIEKVKKRYENDSKVVFLSVNADEDRSLVAGFLKELQWTGPNYYESGLARLLTVSSIPTLLVVGRDGKVSSRMAGFIPERFEDMLVERIEETRTN